MQGNTGALARLREAPLHLKLLCGFALVLALCAAQSVFAYRTAAERVDAEHAQRSHEDTANSANETRTALLQMEAAYRGYLLSADEGLLAAYRAAVLAFSADLADVQRMAARDKADLGRWQTLERRVAVWQHDIIEPGLAQRQVATISGADPSALANPALSQQDIQGIHRLLDEAITIEQTAVERSTVATEDANNRFMAVLLWGTLAVFGVGLPVAGLSARNLARAIAQVHAGQRRYHQMFANNPAIKLVIDSNSGAVVEANQAACDFYGYPQAEMLRLNIADISTLPSDEVANNLSNGAARLQRSFVIKHRLASGEVRDVEVQSSRIDDVTGTVLLYCIIHDITERQRAEAALRTSEERFRNQYKGFPLPTFSWLQVGDDFVLQEFNDAANAIDDGDIRGWVGRRASERYADHPEFLAYLQDCVAHQDTLRRELRYHFPRTGLERDMAITYVFVPPRTVMVHVEDVTEARQAEQQREAMAQSEKLRALGQMATGIAHDINQSLMLVASYSDLARQALTEDPPNLAEMQDLLTTTTQAALDGGETVKRLLVFTRAAPDQDGKRFDLGSVVREAAQLTAPRWRDAAQAEGRPISLHVEAAGHPTILGSPARLRELMTNLIFNAVDALPAGGAIRLRVVAEDEQGVVEVTDSGVGMSAQVQARAFEPFFTTKGEGGTGLGLAMVFGIVEQHGGHIEVQSATGNGTTFRMTFPLAAALAADAGPSPRALAPAEPLLPLRILAVDDEPMMTKALVRMLKPSGHLVSVAGSGEEALEKLAEQTYDVVLSDMGMGAGMNGWELAEAVKKRWPSVRFMLATGWGAAMDPAEFRTKGIEAVLSKPYHPNDLLQALARTEAAAA
jgi:PAS domain S-box-containing protein